jgi:hypothetical protein
VYPSDADSDTEITIHHHFSGFGLVTKARHSRSLFGVGLLCVASVRGSTSKQSDTSTADKPHHQTFGFFFTRGFKASVSSGPPKGQENLKKNSSEEKQKQMPQDDVVGDDVNNDGKKNTKTDKYLKHRRQAVSAAIKRNKSN